MTIESNQENIEPSFALHLYRHEVARATYHLFLLLQEKRRSGIVKPTYAHQPGFRFADLPGIVIYPVLDEYTPDSPEKHEECANQLAFKGWIAHIYGIWDSHHRLALKNSFHGDDTICPEEQVMGDLRHIRHDLLHHAGVATREHSGRCEVLTWFSPGSEMIFEIGHVYDFINQADMLCLHPSRAAHHISNAYSWSFCSEIPEVCRIEDVPRLVSVKTSVDDDSDDGSPRYMMRVVFENGVYGQGLVPFHNDSISLDENREIFCRTTIDESGRLRFRDGRFTSMITLYNLCVKFLLGKGDRGPGMWGNWIKFRR